MFEWQGVRIGLQICEDLWHPQPLQQLLDDDIDLVLSINASPYELNKHEQRLGVLKQRVAEAGKPILYLNNCGAQDELVFDGHSLVLDAEGELVAELPHCEMTTASVTYEDKGIRCVGFEPKAEQNDLAHVYDALVLAVRDYVTKNGFGVALGLSGGIDSALTLAIASDALGADKVHAVMMPFRYTSDMSLEDAEKQADTLDVRYDVVPIEPMFNEFMTQLGPLFGETETDTTEENLQSAVAVYYLWLYRIKPARWYWLPVIKAKWRWVMQPYMAICVAVLRLLKTFLSCWFINWLSFVILGVPAYLKGL